jgi:hypothetical protein
MTAVDLMTFRDTERRREAVNWLYGKYGPTIEGQWSIRDLRYIVFENPKDATYFILKWS